MEIGINTPPRFFGRLSILVTNGRSLLAGSLEIGENERPLSDMFPGDEIKNRGSNGFPENLIA